MSDNGLVEAAAKAAAAQVYEVVIRWVPSSGQVQFASNTNDPVLQLGLLEFAKVCMIEQRVAAASGKGPALVVPARFQS